MIDGLKIRIRGRDQQWLRTHHLLKWTYKGPGRNGCPRYTARWGAFTFHGDETRCTRMVGSFHNQYHGGTNWQDFRFTQFVEVVTSVCTTFGLPRNLALSNVEVGVNIIPPMATAEVLRSIVLHRTSHARPMDAPAQGITICHPDTPQNKRTHGNLYRFKFYDKALHMVPVCKALGIEYDGPSELLRFELAARKMRQLERYGVRTLSDLMEPSTWAALQGYALARFDELLIVEPGIHPPGLRPAQVELLANAGNASYWAGLDKRRRSEKRKMLNDIYTRHAPDGLKATLRRLIAAKLEELNDGPTPDLCPDGVKPTILTARRTFTPTGVTSTDHPEKGPIRTFAPYTIRGAKVRAKDSGDDIMDNRHCLTCGRDISGQDPRSKYCSEQRYGKAGKSCRNAASNQDRGRRVIEHYNPLLFDHTPFIRPLGPRLTTTGMKAKSNKAL